MSLENDNSGTILVVDDLPQDVRLLDAVLAPHGHRVLTARSARRPGSTSPAMNPTWSLISGRTSVVNDTIPVGSSPSGVATNPLTNTAYVANQGDDTISVIAG